jgi:hypothetical protein
MPAFVENRAASGSLGVKESQKLAALFRVAAGGKSPLVLFLDSAGAKVSEGLDALGGFRHLYGAGLECAFSGAPIAAVLGKNCYGGSSMLAHLASRRLFSPNTQLAMSGPSILASAAGVSPLDEIFRAMADAAISPLARSKASGANTVWEGGDIAPWLRDALGPRPEPTEAMRERHAELQARLPKAAMRVPESVRRRDLEKIYSSYEARESDGIFEGRGVRDERRGSVRGSGWQVAPGRFARVAPLRSRVAHASGAAAPARSVPGLREPRRAPGRREGRAQRIHRRHGLRLARARTRGTLVGLTVLGKAGGGVYVALAAPAQRVTSVYGADIQVLPGSAVAAILGESHETAPGFDEYRKSRVADEEIKLGIVPETK